ncbi:MAG: serine--tRNA ligase [Chloroflexi bacterium]|nr:serine--tRNA ligase [Chloroflexota bacterium]|tara:strand:+ start:523 stop:1806 length:1284 start_codon:yes stop_codon:yes gene_type:complete
MLRIDLIRDNPDYVIDALKKRGEDLSFVSKIRDFDTQRRALITERDLLRSQHNSISKEYGSLVKNKTDDSTRLNALRESTKNINEKITTLQDELTGIDKSLDDLLLRIPNIPLESVPEGFDESANKILRDEGIFPVFDFQPRPHWELGENLGIIDFQRGIKISGSRFYILAGLGARLQRALISWMLDVHTREHNYIEIIPPVMVKGKTLEGSGNLPKFSENLYRDIEEDFWWIPTAEVALTGLHSEEILSIDILPLNYVSHTPCFRREKAAHGRETRGIKRLHQFDKIEMYKITHPDDSEEAFFQLVEQAEKLCKLLNLPYRIVELCSGDLGFQSAKTYDIEVWAAGSEEWLEVSSCSNCIEFQAVRSNIRFRESNGAKPSFVHTLNGSGLAIPRILIAILENNQLSDGRVSIPEVLRPYMGCDIIG